MKNLSDLIVTNARICCIKNFWHHTVIVSMSSQPSRVSCHSTQQFLVMFVPIVIFVELPGSCHPTKQIFVILAQIVVFVISVVFAVKLASYYPSCHCTQQFFAIFVKIVVFVVFAVKFACYHPSCYCAQ